MGLLSDEDTGSLIFCFIPALPWPNLDLIWDTPFASDVITGFITCFPVVYLDPIPFLHHVLLVNLCN